MQIESLRIKSYRSWKVDDNPVSSTAKDRHKKLQIFWSLKEEGCSDKIIFLTIGISRATLYRWQSAYKEKGLVGLEPKSSAPKQVRKSQWSKHVQQQVQHLRMRYPLWGKKTLATLLKRERGIIVSESTVGRILKKLITLGRIKPVCFYYGRLKPKKRRVFNTHAKRWVKTLKAKGPGELVQIDHMSVKAGPSLYVKHFEAICPVTKVTIAQSYRNASSQTAAEFLNYVKKQLPFPLRSVQVDGGSEFMKEFESQCEQWALPLHVLPPRCPELNGCVERCNRTLRYEFYNLYDGYPDIFNLRRALAGYMKLYNQFRPHQALAQATPIEYYRKNFTEAA